MTPMSILRYLVIFYVSVLAVYWIATRGYPMDAVLDGVIIGLLIAYATVAYQMWKEGRR